MSTIESRASLIAWNSAKRIGGKSVQYSRGVAVGTLTAIPGDTLFIVEDEDNQQVRVKGRDYTAKRTDIETVIGAGEVPRRGDTITETVADYSRTFRVIEVAGEAFSWWDKAGQIYRIHVVEVSKVTTTAGA